MRYSLYGLVAASLLALKFLAARKRVWTDFPPPLRTAVIIPVYNEDLEAFKRCLASVLDARPTEVWVVDDGSSDTACLGHAFYFSRSGLLYGVKVKVLAQQHAGKRHAMALAMKKSKADIFVTVDSDTVIAPDAITQGLKPFADPKVMAVAGVVRALNPSASLLSRLIDVRYASAFLLDRLAQSLFGSVLCCCGSLAFYRAGVVRRHLADFEAQRFLGREVQYGDDRRMTNYALGHGKVVVQPTSRARTVVPTKLGHFLRQQARWNRSFIRETLWSLRHLSPRRGAWWLAAFEAVSWVVLSTGFTLSLFSHRTAWFVLAAVGMAYLRSARYVTDHGRNWATYALAPLYALLHFTLLLPVKAWALFTLRRQGWGTRQTVEVRLEEAA